MGRPDFYTSYAGIIRIRFKGPETAFLSLHLSREGSQRPCVRLSCGWPYSSTLFEIVKAEKAILILYVELRRPEQRVAE